MNSGAIGGTDTTTPRIERGERLRESLRERELDALLVNDPTDVRYLTGFSGSNALAVIRVGEQAGDERADRFFTDFRYATQSAGQVPDAFAHEVAPNLLDAAARSLADGAGRLGFDDERLTVADHTRLREKLAAA